MRTQLAFALLLGAKEIRVALVAAGLRIAALLTERHPPPEVDGQPLFDYGRQVQHLIHELETAESGVIAADDAHTKQVVRASRLRTERDDKAKQSYDKVLAARQGFDGLQGVEGGFEAIFVSGTSPRLPRRLLDQLGQSVVLLNDPAVEPRTLKVAGFNVDYSEVAGDLESERLELGDAIDRLDAQNKRAEITMLARRQAIEELGSTVIWAGRSAEGLFERAGEHELAKRIRSSTRRPLRPSEETVAADQQAAGEEAAGDESSAGDVSSAGDSTTGESASEPASDSTESRSSAS